MATYMVFVRERVKEAAEIEEYNKLAAGSLAGRSVRGLALYGAVQTLEGPEAQGVVLLEFADREQALEWYNGEAYRTARAHRFLGADYRVIMFEGV
ncbi:hypothetical protein GMST_35270 [Geomonas silvestris]|uniref:DUF1330 domain-containing protein n=1 Tax=Geomonas silvestris TaxID=2740184 RepID=A0A6V8MMK0_9BACT|nr:DUF1330 domain-containing protein [Geomonas silvestris]GFO61202.1 hypothetical protein GMST_35270 [Geomonas silvestris]